MTSINQKCKKWSGVQGVLVQEKDGVENLRVQQRKRKRGEKWLLSFPFLASGLKSAFSGPEVRDSFIYSLTD